MRERRKQQIDMVRMIGFAIFSTRRQEEITRIRWDAIDEARQAVLITDMKNPGQKYGNDVWCHLPDQAWRILHSMPRREEFVFPYNAKSVSASFTRACSLRSMISTFTTCAMTASVGFSRSDGIFRAWPASRATGTGIRCGDTRI